MSTFKTSAKSTKTPYKGGFLIKFFDGKAYTYFFINNYDPKQMPSPPKEISMKKDQYQKAILENGKRAIDLTPNEIVIIGRTAKKAAKKIAPVVSIQKKQKENQPLPGHFTDKALDFFVSKMMDPGRCSSYQSRKNGPGMVLVHYEGFAGSNLLQLAHAN